MTVITSLLTAALAIVHSLDVLLARWRLLHVLHHPLLTLGHKVVELGLLLGREYLNHLRFNSRFLHNHLSHGLHLLSCESAHLGLVRDSRNGQLTSLLLGL